MKKIFITILAVLYFVSSTGAFIRMHFCMGELISCTLNTEERDSKCSKCDMKFTKGCCEEKSQVIKIDKDQKLAIVIFEFSKSNIQIEPAPHQNWQLLVIASTSLDIPKSSAYPGKSKIPLFASSGAFLI